MRTRQQSGPKRHGRGFTLIELLVVIAILAILAVLGFGTIAKATKRARSMQCVQNLRDWSVNFAATAADYNGRLPLPKNWAGISNQEYNAEAQTGRSPFVDYWHEDLNEAFTIQLDKRSCPVIEAGLAGSGNPGTTYMMNWRLGRAPLYQDVYLSELERPGTQIVFIDGYTASPLRLQNKTDIEKYIVPAADAHGGTVNAVFADLHVGPVKPKELSENWNKMITNNP